MMLNLKEHDAKGDPKLDRIIKNVFLVVTTIGFITAIVEVTRNML